MQEHNTLSAGCTAGAPRSLPELENTIRAAAVFELQGALTVGVCLMEAKAQLDHGQWLPWLRKMGIDISYANRRMRLAAEIPAESPLANLSYSKAMALLPLPAGEREQFAREIDAESKSAAEIRRLVQERDHALRDRNEMAAALERERHAAAQAQERPSIIQEVEVAPADYAQLKAQAAQHENEMAEAVQAAEDAEQRAALAEAELRRLQQQGGGHMVTPFQKFADAVNNLMIAAQTLPYQPSLLTGADALRYRQETLRVHNWANEMLAALDGMPLITEAVVE